MSAFRARAKRKAPEYVVQIDPPAQGRGGRARRRVEGRHTLSAATLAAHNEATGAGEEGSQPRCVAGPCLDCHVRRSETTPFQDGVDACTKCFGKYCKGFTYLGTFQTYCAVKHKDAAVRKDAEEAEEFLETEQPTWRPNEVVSGERVKITISKTMAGLTRAQIVEASGGKTPEELGMKLNDMESYDGEKYRGILVPSPHRPWTEYTFSKEVYVDKALFEMQSGEQIHKRQGDASFAFAKGKFDQHEHNSLVLQKMRTAPWTLDDFVAQGGSRIKPAASASAAGASSCAFQPLGQAVQRSPSFYQESAGEHEQDFGEAPPPKPRVLVPCALDAGSVYQSMRVDSTDETKSVTSGGPGQGLASVAGDTSSPSNGGKKRVKMDAGLPVTEGHKDDLVNRRIEACPVEKVLAGCAMGQYSRWVRETMILFRQNGDEARADKLQAHYDLLRHAEALVENPVMTMPLGKLQVAVQGLQHGGESLPISMQKALLKRRMKEQKDTYIATGNCAEMLNTSVPWVTSSPNGTDDDQAEFDGMEPMLAALAVSVLEKGLLFEETLIGTLTGHVRTGTSTKEKIVAFASDVLGYLEPSADDPGAEAYDAHLSNVEIACRVLLSLTCPRMVSSVADFEALEKAGEKKTTTNIHLNALMTALKSSTDWNTICIEYKAKATATMSAMPHIERLEKELSSEDGEGVSAETLQEVMAQLPGYLVSCRQGCCDKLEANAIAAMEQHADDIMKACSGSSDTSALGGLRQTKALLAEAQKVLPTAMANWMTAFHAVVAAETKVVKAAAVGNFLTTVENMSDDTFEDDQKLTALVDVVRNMIEKISEKDLDQHGTARYLCEKAMSFALKKCTSSKKANVLLELAGLLLSVLPNDDSVNIIKENMAVLRAWSEVERARADFMKLGTDTASRLTAASAKNSVVNLLTAIEALSQSASLAESEGPLALFRDAEMTHASEVGQAYTKMHLDTLEEKLGKLEENAKGGKNGGDWTSQIPADRKDDEAKAFEVARTVLGEMDGLAMQRQLHDVNAASKACKEVHELFKLDVPKDIVMRATTMVQDATLTKFTALLVLRHSENEAKPNLVNLRRTVRRYKTSLTIEGVDLWPRLHDPIQKWADKVRDF